MSISSFARLSTPSEMAAEMDRRGSVIERLEVERDALLSLVKRFVALPGGAWHPERHAAEEAELMTDAKALLATLATGQS